MLSNTGFVKDKMNQSDSSSSLLQASKWICITCVCIHKSSRKTMRHMPTHARRGLLHCRYMANTISHSRKRPFNPASVTSEETSIWKVPILWRAFVVQKWMNGRKTGSCMMTDVHAQSMLIASCRGIACKAPIVQDNSVKVRFTKDT